MNRGPRCLAHTLTMLFALLVVAPAGADTWSAPQFQVVGREPTPEEIRLAPSSVDVLEEFLFGDDEDSGPLPRPPGTAGAEGWFDALGGAYRRSDHASPALGPIVEDGGGRPYRVYIFPYDGSRTRDGSSAGGSYETNTCFDNNKVPWLSINHDLAAAPLPRVKFWTIGHEMMHAIMFGDGIMDQCNRNAFEVSEGIPDGAAMYLTNKRFPGFSGRVWYNNSAVGLRSYRLPFFMFEDVPQSQKSWLEIVTGYGSSSFWHYLVEHFGGLKVLPYFLDDPVKKGAGKGDMYRWLDKGLQSLPGLRGRGATGDTRPGAEPPGFFEVYPAFVTEFASYGGSRYLKFNWRSYRSAAQARNAWLKQALGGCRQITLSPEKKQDKVPLGIPENAARCVQVRYEGFKGNVTSRMEIIASRLDQVDQIHLGWAWKIGPDGTRNCHEERKRLNLKWTPCVLKAFTQTGPSLDRYARTWPSEWIDFGESGNKAERVWVFSNVAVDPWKTTGVAGLELKIAVSDSSANGEPTEPVEQMAVPRKKRKTIKSLGDVSREELYGLQEEPPEPDGGFKGASLNTYTPGRDQGKNARPGGYGVGLVDVEYGRTGPVRGTVAKKDLPPGSGVVSSSLCKDGSATPIGEIIRSDEEALVISIDTDLCEAGPSTLQQCEAGCPVVDHLTAEMTVAFGWRQFSETAPTDIRTRGIQRYIDTMPDSFDEAMSSFSNTAFAEEDPFSEEEDTPGPGGSGGGDGSGDALAPCDCSCEEWAATAARGEALKEAKEGGGEITMADLGELMRCQAPCQREYMICAMEAGEEEKAKREEMVRREADAIDCDCSCEGVARLREEAAGIEGDMQKGIWPPADAMQRIGECSSRCRREMMDCEARR